MKRRFNNLNTHNVNTMYDNLYDSLSYNIPSEDISIDDKEYMIKKTDSLTREQKEIIYLLILYHYNKLNPASKVVFPFKIKQTDTYLEIKLDALDNKLKQILLKFYKQVDVEIHIHDGDVQKEENKKRRGRKPKYTHSIILQDINARDIYKRIRSVSKKEEDTTEEEIKSTSILEVNPVVEGDKTTILDFHFTKKSAVFYENNIVRNVQMIDHVDYGCMPSRTDVNCWHCHHDFTTSPIGIPVEYIDRKELPNESLNDVDTGYESYFLTYGVFCSFPCALAYLKYNNDDILFRNSKGLLFSLYFQMYGNEMTCKEAPHWQSLKKYGGDLTIQEFRDSYCLAKFIITDNIKRPFMVAIGKYTEYKKCGCI